VYLNGYTIMGELLIGLTKYFVFYNGERPHQALGNQTPDAVHATSTGGGAMIVDKYGVKPEPSGFPITLRSTATAFGEVRIENESAMQNAKTGAAPSGCVKSGAT
jgi:putative transposase